MTDGGRGGGGEEGGGGDGEHEPEAQRRRKKRIHDGSSARGHEQDHEDEEADHGEELARLEEADVEEEFRALGLPTQFGGKRTHGSVTSAAAAAKKTMALTERMEVAWEMGKKKKKTKKKERSRGGGGGPAAPSHPLPSYWLMRKHLFVRFDAGVRLDHEAWYSVTPECVAERIADRTRAAVGGDRMGVVIDAFAGAGGNAIAFARRGWGVLAVDLCAHRLHLARHNAHIYRVAARIDWLAADCFDVLPRAAVGAVFLSPPWGGPGYKARDEFPLDALPLDWRALLDAAAAAAPVVVVYLPRSTPLREFIALLERARAAWNGAHASLEIEAYSMNDYDKAVAAFIVRGDDRSTTPAAAPVRFPDDAEAEHARSAAAAAAAAHGTAAGAVAAADGNKHRHRRVGG